jgi:hypothetical protein
MREKKQGVPSKISQAAMISRKWPVARKMALKVGKRPAARRGLPGGRVIPLSEKSHPAAQQRRQPLRDPRIASQRVSTGTTPFSVFLVEEAPLHLLIVHHPISATVESSGSKEFFTGVATTAIFQYSFALLWHYSGNQAYFGSLCRF